MKRYNQFRKYVFDKDLFIQTLTDQEKAQYNREGIDWFNRVDGMEVDVQNEGVGFITFDFTKYFIHPSWTKEVGTRC